MLRAPLVITGNRAVRGEIERVAAAAGVALQHCDAVGSTGDWRRAPLVLLDADQVDAAIGARMPRRDRVVVLADHDLDASQWAGCVTLGAHRVLTLGTADDDLVRLLAETADTDAGSGDGPVLAVIGACGGAGATVFAVALGIAAQHTGRAVVLADADPWGPGIDVVLGLEGAEGARWGDIAAPSGRLAAEMLHRALPSAPVGAGSLSVLGHAWQDDRHLDPDLLDTVLDAAKRAGDATIVDLPRVPAPFSDRVLARADLTVLVVPAEVRGCYGAARMVPRLVEQGARLGLVVRGPSPGGLGADDIARTVEVPLLVAMRPEPGLDRALDAGELPGVRPKGPLGKAAAAVLKGLGAAA